MNYKITCTQPLNYWPLSIPLRALTKGLDKDNILIPKERCTSVNVVNCHWCVVSSLNHCGLVISTSYLHQKYSPYNSVCFSNPQRFSYNLM